MQEYVLAYLVSHGYYRTAERFLDESLLTRTLDRRAMEERLRIQQQVLEGRFKEVLA
jgi:hypothetical protein